MRRNRSVIGLSRKRPTIIVILAGLIMLLLIVLGYVFVFRGFAANPDTIIFQESDSRDGNIIIRGSTTSSAAGYSGYSYRVKDGTLMLSIRYVPIVNHWHPSGEFQIEIPEKVMRDVHSIFLDGKGIRDQLILNRTDVETTAIQEEKEAALGPIVEVTNDKQFNEFSIQINGTTVSLKDSDKDIHLEHILGKPISQEVETLGSGSDTLSGSFIKRLKYEGLQFELFSPKQNGKNFWFMTMLVTRNGYKTSREIEVGSTVKQVLDAYPGITIAPDGRTDPDNCAYEIRNEQQYNYLQFEVKEGLVKEIKIYNLIP